MLGLFSCFMKKQQKTKMYPLPQLEDSSLKGPDSFGIDFPKQAMPNLPLFFLI